MFPQELRVQDYMPKASIGHSCECFGRVERGNLARSCPEMSAKEGAKRAVISKSLNLMLPVLRSELVWS